MIEFYERWFFIWLVYCHCAGEEKGVDKNAVHVTEVAIWCLLYA